MDLISLDVSRKNGETIIVKIAAKTSPLFCSDVVHGIYITLIIILILIIVFCPRCSVICDNFCWPYIRTHYNSLANNNTTDDDTPTETAPAKTEVHSTKKNFAVPPETHPKRQTKADIVLAPGGGDKISETISLSSIIARDR